MKKRFRAQFQGLYWRQLIITVGMVLLTLSLLGASFFALSYNYAREQKVEEIQGRARVLGQRDDDACRGGKLDDGVAAVDSLTVHALMRMRSAGKHFQTKHGWRSPFHRNTEFHPWLLCS